MDSISAQDASERLEELIRKVSDKHEPITIHGSSSKAVLISEADWEDIEETLYLQSIPGMVDSIREGMATNLDDCSEDPGW